MTKTARRLSADGNIKVPSGSPARPAERARTIHVPVPKSQGRSFFDLYGHGGVGPLLRRLAVDDDCRNYAPATLNRTDLAQLVELFAAEPMPPALKRAVTAELRGQRIYRKPKLLTPIEVIRKVGLVGFYEAAFVAAKAIRRQRVAAEKSRPRRELRRPIPPVSEIAVDLLKSWSVIKPGIAPKTVANLVAAARRRVKPAHK